MDNLENRISECEKSIAYWFHEKKLLKQALTHSSCANTHIESNERLEFLGDAVLGQVVSIILYNRLPRFSEGDLSRVKSAIVSRKTCRKIALNLGLERFLLVGKGVGAVPDSLVSNVLEAVIGAILLDGGYEAARKFVEDNFTLEIERFFGYKRCEFKDGQRLVYLSSELENISDLKYDSNFKASLQTKVQRENPDLMPEYVLLDEQGPAHKRCFKIGVKIGDHKFQAAWGNSKKETEQNAAENALYQMQGLTPPHSDGEFDPNEKSLGIWFTK